MKKVYLIHCWSGSIEDGWYPWLKNHLIANSIELIMENMPNTDQPTIDEWVNKLDDLVSNIDENTYFVGHSIGCQTILRYLEKKNPNVIGGLLFVAPWFDLIDENLEEGSDVIANPWINTPIDLEKIKLMTSNITCIFSSNDYFVNPDQAIIFKEKLNAKTIFVTDKGHISGEDGINELPDILLSAGKMLGLELLEEVDETDNKTGRILDKELLHNQNLLHREVGLYIINSSNQLLLQKRSPNKRFNPNKWGLCAGHVDAYEENEDAVIREAKEEIGLDINKDNIHFIRKILKQRTENSNFAIAYYTFLDKDIKEFVIQEEELTEVKWWDLDLLKTMINNNDPTISFTNNEDNNQIFNKLNEILMNKYKEK